MYAGGGRITPIDWTKGCVLNVSKGYKYGFDWYLFKLYDFNDKEQALRNYMAYMLNRTQMIFEYEGLPDTIPAKFLELLLQINGYACIAEEILFSAQLHTVPNCK